MTDLDLLIGGIGAITGIVSLIWHILNSRSRVILERVSFTKSNRHTHKVTIDVNATIRNKSNRATTIEEVYLEFGKMWITLNLPPIEIKPNSSHNLKFSESITFEEFNNFVKMPKIKLGLDITHTFGRIKKQGYTDFSTPWLNL